MCDTCRVLRRALLITGITGFVGGALAARWKGRGGTLVAIVRARTVSHGRERVAASVARFVGPEAAADLVEATTIVLGDLADPRVYDHPALDTVTHGVHGLCIPMRRDEPGSQRSRANGRRRLKASPRLSHWGASE